MNFINDDQIENNIELDNRNIDIDLVDIDLDLNINLLHLNPSFKKNIQYGNLNTLVKDSANSFNYNIEKLY